MRVGIAGRWTIAVVVAMASLAVQPLTGRSQAAAAAEPAERPDTASALVLARQSGEPVEVTGLRSEYAQVFANPAGSFTLKQSVLPQRARRPDGSWVPVDTTLRVLGGSVVPVAVPLGVTLSAGGGGALFTLSERGASLALSWPRALPTPTLSGNTATYPDVLPGVDLAVRVSATGVSHTLVVKSASAAANPELERVRYGLSTSGVTVSSTGGVTRAVDADGEAVFVAPTPRMWDTPAVDGVASLSAAATEPPREVAMPIEVSASEVVLRPDAAMLADPSTRWPVYIDPEWIGQNGAGMDWTQVYSNNAGTSYWRGSDLVRVGFEQGNAQKNRSFFQFNTANIEGKQILQAFFGVDEQYAWTCTLLPVSLYVTGAVSPSTTWNNQPAWPGSAHGTIQTGYGYSSSCPAKRVSWGVQAPVASAAGATGTVLTFGLRTPNESLTNPSNWHKYAPASAALWVEFNSYPNAPVDVRTDGKPACGSGASRLRVRSLTPTLSARLSDVDQGTMPGEFVYQKWTGSAWGAASSVGTAPQAAAPPGSVHQITLSLAAGDVVRWQVRGTNPLGAPWNTVVPGPWGPWCEFEVDTTTPGTPGPVSSVGGACPQFPLPAPTTCVAGAPAGFTLSPPSGETDVAGYLVGVGQSGSVTPITWVRAASGGSATAQLAPAVSGLNEVQAKTVDWAGNISVNTVTYRFNARAATPAPNGPAARWQLERRPGDPVGDLIDRSGNGRTLTASGGYSLASDARLWGAQVGHFDGTSAFVATSGPVIATNASFSVAAWVKLANTNYYASAVSQDGSRQSGFSLQYSWDVNRFSMSAVSGDVDNPTVTRGPTAPSAPQLNVWTHLVGVYDAGAGQLLLYVNGSLAGTVAYQASWNATGAMTLGRVIWNGGPLAWWPGEIADVRVWPRAISAAEAGALPGTVEVGRASFEGECCAAARDATTFNRSLYLYGGAGYSSSGHAGSALQLDGVSGVAASAAPVLRTDQSFTVSAWARPAANSNGWRSIVVANGVRTSSFMLRRDGTNKWNFTWIADDAMSSVGGVSGTSTSAVGVWTHVAAVYDASAKQARLYVNGALEGTVAVTAMFAPAGPLVIGGDLWADYVNYWGPWHGDIDEVRMFQGAMTGAEIQALFQQ